MKPGQTGIIPSRRRLMSTDAICSRVICPGGAGFETSSTKGDMGVVRLAHSTRPALHGVSVLLIDGWFGLQISKLDDK